MSLLPGQILPATEPLGRVTPDGLVIIDKNWWLLLYNVCLQILGTGNGIPADQLIDLASADGDAIDADAIMLRQGLSNALMLAHDPPRQITSADLPDIFRALLLAQEALLTDPTPQAQPAQSITVGASPFTYTAPFDGTLVSTGGTVSAIAIIRQSTTVATGLTSGLIPLSRSDKVQVTYSASPTMTFLPR
jgi:hypothetical protein